MSELDKFVMFGVNSKVLHPLLNSRTLKEPASVLALVRLALAPIGGDKISSTRVDAKNKLPSAEFAHRVVQPL